MDLDEVVADGAPFHHRAAPFKVEELTFSTPSDSVWASASSINQLKSSTSKSTTDSGFISGVNLSDNISSSGEDYSSETTNMKIANVPTLSSLSDQGHSDCLQKKGNLNLNDLDSQSTSHSNLNYNAKPITLEDLLRQDEDGDTPLHLAVLQGFIEIVFSLVRIFPEPWFLEVPNKRSQTPLHLAVLTNQAPLVRRLVVGGANVQSRDRHGNTPLHLACRDGHVDCVKALCMPVSQEEREVALLHHDIPPQPLPQDLEQRNYDGQMPLHLAVMSGHLQVVRQLCCFGANVDAVEGKNGRTPLHYAVERRWPAVLHFLVAQCGAKLEAVTYCGYSAYQLATVAAPMLAVLLVQLGAKPRPMPLDISSGSDNDSDGDSQIWRPDKEQDLALFQNTLHLTT